MLQDSERVSSYAAAQHDCEKIQLSLLCVRSAVSSLATLADSTLGDVADPVLRYEYILAERLKPCADAVAKVI